MLAYEHYITNQSATGIELNSVKLLYNSIVASKYVN